MILTSPLFTILRHVLPHSQIDVYLFKETLPMLEGHRSIDHFITFDQKWRKKFWPLRMCYEIAMWAKIRSRKYDLVLNMTSGDRGAIATKVSGARIRVGIEPENGIRGKRKWFTHLVSITKNHRHIVERNLDSLRAIGIIPEEGAVRDLVFEIPTAAHDRVSRLIPYKDFVLVHPVSRCSYKHWPAKKFAELISHLKKKGENVVISGGPGKEEAAFIQEILVALGGQEVVNLSGQTSLKELGALIARSKLLISVDSAPPHIASALKKPVLVLFGPSDDIKWGPWQNPHGRVVRLDLPCKRCDQEGCGNTQVSDCMLHLPVQLVLSELEKML